MIKIILNDNIDMSICVCVPKIIDIWPLYYIYSDISLITNAQCYFTIQILFTDNLNFYLSQL